MLGFDERVKKGNWQGNPSHGVGGSEPIEKEDHQTLTYLYGAFCFASQPKVLVTEKKDRVCG